jgi:hypothetical protein
MMNEPDPIRLSVILECMETYEVGEAWAEWPNNIISRRAVVYRDGAIVREEDVFPGLIDATELALCQGLGDEVAGLMHSVSVGMGSQADNSFHPFFILGSGTASLATSINEQLVRDRFGGTIFPQATITVEPLSDGTIWWNEVLSDGEGCGETYFAPWTGMVDWFSGHSAFVASAFVRIGDPRLLAALPNEASPNGTVIAGGVLPRLALGLTRNGSLVGLFGAVVSG